MAFDFLRNNLFFRNKVITGNLIGSVVLNFLMLVWLYIRLEPRVEPVAIRYTIYFGVDLIGPWWHVFIFPLFGAVINLTNFVLAYLIFLRVKVLSYILVLSSILVQVILIIMSILVVLLNG